MNVYLVSAYTVARWTATLAEAKDAAALFPGASDMRITWVKIPHDQAGFLAILNGVMPADMNEVLILRVWERRGTRWKEVIDGTEIREPQRDESIKLIEASLPKYSEVRIGAWRALYPTNLRS